MEFQAHKYIFLLVILFCHEVLLAEGRQLKSKHRTESKQSSLTPKSQSGGFVDSGAVEGEEDFSPTTAGGSPGVGHPLEQNKEDSELQGIKRSVMGSKDDFRPTTPGNSPGVGHYLAGKEQKAPSTDGFRPTTPGDSPEVGHYSHVQDTHENEQKSVSQSFSDADDFKPTNPGHSPGVGHSVLN